MIVCIDYSDFVMVYGYSFECNSTVEQFMVHLITKWKEFKYKILKHSNKLPIYHKQDNNMRYILQSGLVDIDILMLFDNNKNIKDKIDENNICYKFLDLHNMNPSKWFVPFDNDKMNDYKLDIPTNQATI